MSGMFFLKHTVLYNLINDLYEIAKGATPTHLKQQLKYQLPYRNSICK